jgi:hypothetical protein
LAFAIAVKFYPAIFLLYFALRRDGWFLLACLGSTMALLVLPEVWIGWERGLQFQAVAAKALFAARETWIHHDPNSQFLPHVVRRIWGFGSGEGWVIGRSLAYGGCVGLLLVAWAAVRRDDASSDLAARMLFFLATPLWVPTSWPHYFCYLPASQWLLLDDLAGRVRRSRSVIVAAGGLVALSVAFSSVFALQASDGWYRYSSQGFLLAADLALALAYCVSLSRFCRQPNAPVA